MLFVSWPFRIIKDAEALQGASSPGLLLRRGGAPASILRGVSRGRVRRLSRGEVVRRQAHSRAFLLKYSLPR